MKWLASILKGSNPIESIFNGIDKLSTSNEEKEELRLQALKIEIERQQVTNSEKDSARHMYAKDNSLQKVYAIVFLLAYVTLTSYLAYSIVVHTMTELTQWQAGFISGLFGAMSAKVNTITDFLFGGSQGENDNKLQDHLTKLSNEKPR